MFTNCASSILKSIKGRLPLCSLLKAVTEPLIYSPTSLSAHSSPHVPLLDFSLFTLLSCHWRSVKIAVKGCLLPPRKQAILFCFLLLNVFSSSANPRVLPFIRYPVNLPSSHTPGHDTPVQVCYHFPLSTRSVIQSSQVFPLQWGYSEMLPHATNVSAFSVSSYLKVIQFVLNFLISFLFRVSLKLGSSASFISTFLTLCSMVISENTQQDKFLRANTKELNK